MDRWDRQLVVPLMQGARAPPHPEMEVSSPLCPKKQSAARDRASSLHEQSKLFRSVVDGRGGGCRGGCQRLFRGTVLALLVLDQCALSCVHFVTLVALERTLTRLVGAAVDAEVASLWRLRLPLFLLLGHKTFKIIREL